MPHRVYQAGSPIRHTSNHRFDYIVCANKNTGDFTSTLRDLATLVHSDTTLVAAQNGMDVELPLLQAFPRNTVLSAICNIGCSQVSPGLVEQTTRIKRPAFLIGLYGHNHRHREIDAERRDTLVAMDSQFAGVESANHERWLKLIFNSAINSTTALTGLNAQQLLQQPGAEDLIARLASEAYHVGVASGVELDRNVPSKTVELARSIGPLVPSTLQDVRNRRPLELSPIFGTLSVRFLLRQSFANMNRLPGISSCESRHIDTIHDLDLLSTPAEEPRTSSRERCEEGLVAQSPPAR